MKHEVNTEAGSHLLKAGTSDEAWNEELKCKGVGRLCRTRMRSFHLAPLQIQFVPAWPGLQRLCEDLAAHLFGQHTNAAGPLHSNRSLSPECEAIWAELGGVNHQGLCTALGSALGVAYPCLDAWGLSATAAAAAACMLRELQTCAH